MKILKWARITVVSLLAVLCGGYLVILLLSEFRINTKHHFTDTTITIPKDSLSIVRGKHVFQIRSCQDCHGKNGEGSLFMDSKMLLQLTAPNLTKGVGGLPSEFDEADWVRVLRHGVNSESKSLFMMPSHEVANLTNEDLANLIAFCKSLAPVNTSQKKLHSIGPIGRLLLVLNQVTVLPAEKIDHKRTQVNKVLENVSAAFGQYLSTGCQGCHRSDLRGGGPLAPGYPPVPDITVGGALKNWNEHSFIATIRTGKTPEGKALDNQFMPWQSIGNFTDDELRSIYLYLKSLPAKPL